MRNSGRSGGLLSLNSQVLAAVPLPDVCPCYRLTLGIPITLGSALWLWGPWITPMVVYSNSRTVPDILSTQITLRQLSCYTTVRKGNPSRIGDKVKCTDSAGEDAKRAWSVNMSTAWTMLRDMQLETVADVWMVRGRWERCFPPIRDYIRTMQEKCNCCSRGGIIS
mmetsp:Transcript_46979/g.77149  ORF Transcript_46979/g.77149 Transcript_46979/m.77149 type:complete len:166 (+) Transcript_46979:465-962(+)